MAKDDKRIEEVGGVPAERQGTRPDFSTPPPRKQLPKELQEALNDEEKLWEVLYDGGYVPHAFLYSTHATP
jgi:fission process protein 1